MRGRRIALIAGILVVVLAAVGGWWYTHRSIGTVWNDDKTIAVRVAPGGATGDPTIKFAVPTIPTPESELSKLVDVVVPAVDIRPIGGTLTNASVIFTLNLATLPKDNGRSINNAGIEVFNESVGTWVPIPTTVEHGNQLVAHAPHFSIFRAVINKIGEVILDAGRAVKVVLTKALKTIDLLWSVGLGLFKTFFMSITGNFDNSKFACKPLDSNYTVSVTDATGQRKMAACMVQGASADSLLVKNGLAIPMKFTAGGVPDLSVNFGNADDIISMVRSFVDMLMGQVVASGLDVASLRVGRGVPGQFTVNGAISWVAAAVDIAIGLISVMMPETKTIETSYRGVLVQVEQRLSVTVGKSLTKVEFSTVTTTLQTIVKEKKIVSTLYGQAMYALDAVNCLVGTADAAKIRSWSDVPGTLVGMIQKCMGAALRVVKLDEYKEAVDGLNKLVSQAKLVPEIGQLAAVAILDLFTGGNVAKIAFDVRRGNPQLDPLVGRWISTCSLTDSSALVVNPDYTAVYGKSSASAGRTYTAQLHLVYQNGMAVGVVDQSDVPDLGKGTRVNLVYQNGTLYLGLGGGAPLDQLYPQASQHC